MASQKMAEVLFKYTYMDLCFQLCSCNIMAESANLVSVVLLSNNGN